MRYSKENWKLAGFAPSLRKHKKYEAIIENRDNGEVKYIHFGDSRYKQYEDSTGVGAYSKKDHKDKERRKRYRARHKRHVDDTYYSPAYFSYYYLW